MKPLFTLLALSLLAGCSAGMNEDFSCSGIDGIDGCVSMTEVNQMADSGQFQTDSQGITDFFKSSESQAAYNNSDIKIVLRQGSDFDTYIKDNPTAFTPSHVQLIKRFPEAKMAGFSCAMIRAGSTVTFHRLFVDPWSIALYSSDPRHYEYCEQLMHNGAPLLDAIEETAWKFYPTEMASFEKIKTLYHKEKTHDAS